MSGVTAVALTGAAGLAATAGAVKVASDFNKQGKVLKRDAAIARDSALAQPVETVNAQQDTMDTQQKTRAKRANLFATAGGVSGQELQVGQVQQRPTLLGN